MMLDKRKDEISDLKKDVGSKVKGGKILSDADIGFAVLSLTEAVESVLYSVDGLAKQSEKDRRDIEGALKEIRMDAQKQRFEDAKRYPNQSSLNVMKWLVGVILTGIAAFTGYLWNETHKAKEVDAVQTGKLDVHSRVIDNFEKRIEYLERRKP